VTLSASSSFVATDASGYERLMGRWSRRLAEPFLDFVGTAPGERVLDVGCGTGALAEALLQRGPVQALHGVDLAPPYVAAAGARVRAPGVAFHVGDACALDFADHHFDRVFCLLVLHFVPKAELALAEMRRVARPGATVGAAVWDARGGFVANRMFWDTAAALDPHGAGERRARNYTRPMTRPGDLGRAWRAAGFENVEDTSLAMRMDYASFDDYWTSFSGTEGPHAEYVATLDDPGRVRLSDALRRAYLDGEADGPRSYAALAWAVKGTAPR
jgi:SAM-dependent methyltransferase